jgi:hypothetical protein
VNYDVRLDKDGLIEEAAPVDVYWVLREGDGRRGELGFFERRVYGATATVSADRRSMELVIRGMPTKPLQVRLGEARPAVETDIGGRAAILEEVFISCGKLTIDSIRIRGRTSTGKPVEETIRK